MSYNIKTLSNGIRFVHQPCIDSEIMHLCIAINTGSRDESDTQVGMAHFIEHMLFKGTSKRNNFQVLNRMEVVGADVNAYTTKEQTFLHTSFLSQYIERALELFCDIIFNSSFPNQEIEKEKGVVLDEIESYKDAPEELILDDFDAILYKNNPLGNNILGSAESVNSFTRESLIDFIKNNYYTNNIVFGLYGNISDKKLNTLISKHIDIIPAKIGNKTRLKPVDYKPQDVKIQTTYNQTHFVLGCQTYSIYQKEKIGLMLLNNILGGPNMSSRLNIEIREKFGACYSIESNYSPMCDIGQFSIYFGTELSKKDRCIKLIYKELDKLCSKNLSTLQLYQAKQRFKGQIALGEESRMSVISAMAKNILDYNSIITIDDVFKSIDSLQQSDLLDIANNVFNKDNFSSLIYLPNN